MAQSNAQKQLMKYDADIAVLQVEFKNLDAKFDTGMKDVKEDINRLSLDIKDGNESTHRMLIDFQKSNQRSHDIMAEKIAGLEKWRWILVGAGLIIGGLGYSGIEALLGLH